MKMLLALLAFLPLSITACAQSPQGSLDTKAFKVANDKNDALLIDLRTPDEFKQGHIEGAANINWSGGTLLSDVSGIDKTKPVLLYCAGGKQSDEAMEVLKKAGFTDIHNLKGGFHAWEADKQPVITQ